MRRRRSITLTATLAALAAATTISGTAAAAPGDQRAAKASPYVAMGDSYSSGAGIQPLVPGSPAGCSRSTLNFGQVIADRTGSRDFTDVSCSGAQTRDFFTAQYPDAPPQLDALNKNTRLVTMTIGGNDGSVFTRSFLGCISVTATDPTGNPCERAQGDTLINEVESNTYPALVRALSAVRAKAPKAKVAILGYPRILPEQGSPACTATMLVAQGDVPYLNRVQTTLNSAVRRAAAETGVTYVDLWGASTGRDACQSPTVRWIEPVAAINAAPVHPNARGEAAMATHTISTLGLKVR